MKFTLIIDCAEKNTFGHFFQVECYGRSIKVTDFQMHVN